MELNGANLYSPLTRSKDEQKQRLRTEKDEKMSNYRHVSLTQEFRPIALRALRGLPSWKPYFKQHGLKSNGLSSADIHDACKALGLDLVALEAQWKAGNVAPIDTNTNEKD